MPAATVGAERADRTGGVETLVVVIRLDRLGDLAFGLEAGGKRRHEALAADASDHVGDGERGHERRHGRVGEQAVGPVRAFRQLGVVPVHGVAGGAVAEGRLSGGDLDAGVADEARLAVAAEPADVAGGDLHDVLFGAGQRHREAVEHASADQVPRILGNVRVGVADGKRDRGFGQAAQMIEVHADLPAPDQMRVISSIEETRPRRASTLRRVASCRVMSQEAQPSRGTKT